MLQGDGAGQASGVEAPRSRGFAAQLSDNEVNTKGSGRVVFDFRS
jgi:hypothetical protein